MAAFVRDRNLDSIDDLDDDDYDDAASTSGSSSSSSATGGCESQAARLEEKVHVTLLLFLSPGGGCCSVAAVLVIQCVRHALAPTTSPLCLLHWQGLCCKMQYMCSTHNASHQTQLQHSCMLSKGGGQHQVHAQQRCWTAPALDLSGKQRNQSV